MTKFTDRFLLIAALPTLATAAASSSNLRCQDNPSFRFQGVDEYDCEWIAAQDDGICEWSIQEGTHSGDIGSTIGSKHCPVSCGECEREAKGNIIYSSEVCHGADDKVRLFFENEYPESDDWLGIYPDSMKLEEGVVATEDPLGWTWLCVDKEKQNCKSKYNEIAFPFLPAGIYTAVLVRGDDKVYAVSKSFEVVEAGQICSQRRLTEPDCQPSISVNQESFQVGEVIPIHLEQCADGSASSEDFVAIYDANTDPKDIKGDANYRLWMWACGNQFCHEATLSKSLSFGPENNRHTWPLPPGEYQAHLITRDESTGRFSSSAATSEFLVSEELSSAERKLQIDCLDEVKSISKCYGPGEAVSVLLKNECEILSESDWIGFVEEDDCSEGACDGEVAVWSDACHGSRCNHKYTEYHFKSESPQESLLTPGRYVVALFDKDDQSRLVSEPFSVVDAGESCHVVYRSD